VNQYKNIVVKVGTNVLTNEDGSLDLKVIGNLVSQISDLKKQGIGVVLVSSGAVGAGQSITQLSHINDEVTRRQAYSAIGQVKLMGLYAEQFEKHGLVCDKVLATKDDFTGKEHYKNMLNCFNGLRNDSIIPIVNENDVVSLTELMFTDNDELAALTAFMIKADALVILTSVDGLYVDFDNKVLLGEYKKSESIADLEKYVDKHKSSQGRGGMSSKIEVARRMKEKHIVTHIANGKFNDTLLKIVKGETVGTTFEA
jgi:glutamate 5-kinase